MLRNEPPYFETGDELQYAGKSKTATASVRCVTGSGEPGDMVTLSCTGDSVFRIADDGGLETRWGARSKWEHLDE